MLELLFLAFIIFLLSAAIQGMMEIKVKKISTLYNRILDINKTTYFHKIPPLYPIKAVLNSKKEFDTLDFDSIMQENLMQEDEVSLIELYVKKRKRTKPHGPNTIVK